MEVFIAFGLDIVILIALGVTIFYAVTLSRKLNNFRLQREEFTKFMNELTGNIDQAVEAVENLKQASLATGDQLRRKVREGQLLHDELDQILASGDRLAQRLEEAASGSSSASLREAKSEEAAAKPAKAKKTNPVSDPSFAIQDLDDEGAGQDDTSYWNMDEIVKGVDKKPTKKAASQKGKAKPSKAEQELLDALKKNKKGKTKKTAGGR